MARRASRGAALGLALLLATAGAAPAAQAQVAGASAELVDAATPTGAGVVLHVRVGEPTAVGVLAGGPPGASGPAAAGGRPGAVRLVSADGAVAPARFEAETGYGVYAFRADLPTPGAWTLSFTLRRPSRPDAPVVLGFTAQGPLRAPLRTDPAGPALAPADPEQSVQPAPATPPTR